MRGHAEATVDAAALTCYHCGESVPPGCRLSALVGGRERPMCCPGCAAVAQMIEGIGLAGFYRQRTAYSERPDRERDDRAARYAVYDDPELAATFCSRDGEGPQASATLLVGGITCAACTWLIEKSLGELPGVRAARVSLQTGRLDLSIDTALTPLSGVFAWLDDLGYRPRPYRDDAQREEEAARYRSDLRRVAVAGLGMMQVGMFAVALHAGDVQGMEDDYRQLLRWVSLPVATLVVLYSARPFFVTAWRHLRHGHLVMDLPVALAIGLAFLASTWATLRGEGQVYFDSVVMFTFFLLLGRLLESRARRRRARPGVDAAGCLPEAVTVMRGGEWRTEPRLQVGAGDRVLLRRGETVPVDGSVQAGGSSVREDTFSGEHLPRAVGVGDTVYAGTVNLEGDIELRAFGGYRETRLWALERAVESAGRARPMLEQLADRVASRFVAAVLLIAAATAAAWYFHDPDRALWVTLSVLVVSCPCALALATPAALAGAAGALRARGVAVHGENALEALARCTCLLLDKTGTLTRGELSLQRVQVLGSLPEASVRAAAAALQRHSNHPVSRAFAGMTAASGFATADYRIGAGIESVEGGTHYRMGSERFCREIAPALPPAPDAALYWVALCRDGEPLAWFGLDDRPREAAAALVGAARDAGLKVELVTGDSSPQAPRLAAELGIAEVRHGLTPEEKMARVEALQRAGEVVAMVGDGVNDAPVLGLADVSFAVSGATDLARARADFVLFHTDLGRIMETWRMARRCRRVILQNFSWALLYNLCAVPLAALGLVPPWAAAAGMSLSSLLVVGNSLRLNH